MPLKLSVGLSQKVGQPDYGSLGASCHVDLEVDASLLHGDVDGLQRQIRHAYGVCEQAVHEQLFKQKASAVPQNGNGTNGHANGNGATNGYANGSASRTSNGTNGNGHSAPRAATQSQVRALRSIAQRQHIDLELLLGNRFGSQRPDDLTLTDASNLIDELKSAPASNGSRR